MTRRVPTSPAEIDVDWLNDTIPDRAQPFTSIEVEPLGADTGMYGRLALVRATSEDRSAPAAVFVAKFASASPETRDALGKGGLYRNEYEFYTRMARDFPIRVPRCYFAHYDASTYETLLLLEALDGEFYNDLDGATRAQAMTAVSTARRMHEYWAQPGRLDGHAWLPRLAGSDFYRSWGGMDADFVRHALRVIGDFVPDWLRDRALQAGRILQSQFDLLDTQPSTLIHTDFRLSNMCFDAGVESMTLVDWQMPYRGPGFWDVSAFSILALTTQNRRAWLDELVERYLDVARTPDWARTALFVA